MVSKIRNNIELLKKKKEKKSQKKINYKIQTPGVITEYPIQCWQRPWGTERWHCERE